MTLDVFHNANSDDFARLWSNLVGEPLEVSRQRGIETQARLRTENAEYSELMRLRTAEMIAGIRARRESFNDHTAESLSDPIKRRRAA